LTQVVRLPELYGAPSISADRVSKCVKSLLEFLCQESSSFEWTAHCTEGVVWLAWASALELFFLKHTQQLPESVAVSSRRHSSISATTKRSRVHTDVLLMFIVLMRQNERLKCELETAFSPFEKRGVGLVAFVEKILQRFEIQSLIPFLDPSTKLSSLPSAEILEWATLISGGEHPSYVESSILLSLPLHSPEVPLTQSFVPNQLWVGRANIDWRDVHLKLGRQSNLPLFEGITGRICCGTDFERLGVKPMRSTLALLDSTISPP
jgi:hypothetical protein